MFLPPMVHGGREGDTHSPAGERVPIPGRGQTLWYPGIHVLCGLNHPNWFTSMVASGQAQDNDYDDDNGLIRAQAICGKNHKNAI